MGCGPIALLQNGPPRDIRDCVRTVLRLDTHSRFPMIREPFLGLVGWSFLRFTCAGVGCGVAVCGGVPALASDMQPHVDGSDPDGEVQPGPGDAGYRHVSIGVLSVSMSLGPLPTPRLQTPRVRSPTCYDLVRKPVRDWMPMVSPVPTTTARAELPATVRRFREQGETADPVVFGNHRRAEAVIMPAAQYDLFLELVEDAAIAMRLAERAADDTGRRYTLSEVAAELGVELPA